MITDAAEAALIREVEMTRTTWIADGVKVAVELVFVAGCYLGGVAALLYPAMVAAGYIS